MSILTAQQLEENEQYDKAYEEYKKVTKPSVDVLERLGHLATILEKQDEAKEYYNQVLEKDPTNALAYEQLMDIYVHTDKYKYYISRGNLHVIQEEITHAISDFKKALDKAQNDNEINATRFVLASLYEKTGKNANAIDEYLRILESSATNELTYMNLAQVYLKEKSILSAIDTLERAVAAGYDSANIKEQLAQLYLQNNQHDKARKYTNDELTKVKSYLDEEQNEKAFAILEKVREENKKNPNYYTLLSQYYYNQKDWEKSLEAVVEFEKFDKASPLGNQMRALIYEEKGEEYLAHMNWAKYNLKRGNKDVALNDYYMALKINEDDSELIRSIAELLEEMNDKTQAGEFWGMLTKLEPTDKRALEKFADFKEKIGDYRAQVEILEQLYKVSNKNLLVIKKLANACERQKNKEKALEYYNLFVKYSPMNEDYEQAKLKIQKLSSAPMEEDEGLLDKIMKLFNR